MRSHAEAPFVRSVWIAAGMALVLGLLLLGIASDRAAAATGRPYLETLPTTGTNPGSLTADAAGNLYLGNIVDGNEVVEKLDASGNPVNFTGSTSDTSGNKLLYGAGDSAISKANGFIFLGRSYLPSPPGGEVTVFAPSGEYLGRIQSANQYQCGVGIDQNNGDLYRSGGEERFIPRYEVVGADPSNYVLKGRVKMPLEYNGACNVEVDSTGAIYASTAEGQLVKFAEAEVSAPTGTPTVAPGTVVASYGARATAVSVESSSDNVFADLYERGYEYGPGGALVAEYPALGGSAGAVFSGGKLLVSRRLGGILVFGGLTQLPLAKTEAASDIHPDEVTLHGEVDPDSAGNVTGCEFKYGIDQRYAGGTVPCDAALPITSATAVDAQLGGLDPATTYHYQLVVENGNGVQLSADQTFTTLPAVESAATGDATGIDKRTATLNGSFVGRGEDVHYYFEYGTSSSYGQTVPVPPGNDAGSVIGPQNVAVAVAGLQGGTEYHYRLVATNVYGQTYGEERTFITPPAVTALKTGPATGVANASAELNGSFEADGFETHYYFEWGQTTAYGNVTPVPPGNAVAPGGGVVNLPPVTISGLAEGVRYHYRVVATNEAGITYGADANFRAAEAPLVGNLNTRNVQATSAELTGEINPRYGQTSYFFEWGETATYGNKVPVPPGDAGSGDSLVPVSASVQGLTPGLTYHFRLVASSQYGTTISPDQTFGFYPPACPNSQLRQETRSNDLPDCRAYELVSAGFAQGAMLIPSGGPVSGLSTSPSRLAFGAVFGLLPETTGEGTNSIADLYVATRTDTGWGQRYVGLRGTEGIFMGGSPAGFLPTPTQGILPRFALRGVQATPSLDRVINYNWGFPGNLTLRSPGSNGPYLWDTATGSLIERWPSNLAETPGGEHFVGFPQASDDLSHFVFSSNVVFAPGGEVSGGVLEGGGQNWNIARLWPEASIYDNDTASGTVELASKTKAGVPFKGRVFDISDDGSHILMTKEAEMNPNGEAIPAPLEPKQAIFGAQIPGPLYLRVDGNEVYEIAPGHQLEYVASTADGATVYLTSTDQLTTDDHDSSRDIFVWRESDPGSLTRVSVGDHGNAGDTDECAPNGEWSVACGASAVPVNVPISAAQKQQGNDHSDNAVASASGDIYFESPEQLVGAKGEQGARNLYLFRAGTVRYVATMQAGGPPAGTVLPVKRMQITPDGKYMALVTASNLNDYDSGGRSEMYSYSPESGRVVCVSCRPDGQQPVSDVLASQNGLFLTYDGRTFFSTKDALVARDTNQTDDVYEFTEGKAQLITTGIGSALDVYNGGQNEPGLVGVSANGIDVYFATIDTLVTQDHNGASTKIYNARTGGGFPAEREEPKCAAADECHGPGAPPPPPPADRTSAGLGGPAKKASAKKKKAKKQKKARKQKQRKKRAGKAKAKRHSDSGKQGGRRHG